MATLTDLQTYSYNVTNKETGETEKHFGVSFRLDSVSLNIAYSDFPLVKLDYSEKNENVVFGFGCIRTTISFKHSNDLQFEMLEALKHERQTALDRI